MIWRAGLLLFVYLSLACAFPHNVTQYVDYEDCVTGREDSEGVMMCPLFYVGVSTCNTAYSTCEGAYPSLTLQCCRLKVGGAESCTAVSVNNGINSECPGATQMFGYYTRFSMACCDSPLSTHSCEWRHSNILPHQLECQPGEVVAGVCRGDYNLPPPPGFPCGGIYAGIRCCSI